MKKAGLFLLLSFLVLRTVASSVVDLPASPTDTVPYTISEEDILDYEDSLLLFPAYDIYCGWDTHNIHTAKFDIKSLSDSVRKITLFDENSCGFVPPFSGNITSGFGPRKRRYHYGADIDLQTGDAVSAAFDGKVRIAQKSKTYGNVVVIRHNNGLETYYAHLSRLNVKVDEDVFAGDIIGLGGNTGRSRGSHLHFEVRYLGQPINPCDLISFSENKLISDTLLISKKTFEYVQANNKLTSKKGKSGKVHTVKKGDTIYSLAKAYKTSTKTICQKNGIKPNTTLRLGQRLKI